MEHLGFVYIDDDAIDIFSEGRLGTNHQFGLYWPRHLFGRVIRELTAQGAHGVGLDVLFGELRHDHPPIQTETGPMDSDLFFQAQLQRASNVILGATSQVIPHSDFRSAAWAMGDISTERDADGVLRRARLFQDYWIWHSNLVLEARLHGWRLDQATVTSNELVIPYPNHRPVRIALTEGGLFDPRDLGPGKKRGVSRLYPAFEEARVWHLGVVLGARQLGIDLSKAKIDPKQRHVVLTCAGDRRVVVPVDRDGCMLIDWNIHVNDSRLTQQAFDSIVANDIERQLGSNIVAKFKDKIVVVGSVATGNELSDRGATPLGKESFLTGNHWNVANSIITARFIHKASAISALTAILIAGAVSAWLTARFPTLGASAAIIGAAVVYAAAVCLVFIQSRLWLPMISPIAALAFVHVGLMSYQAFFEESERRRIRQIFSKIVSPNVVNELLRAEKLSLVGARRQITVMFADVRGFTEMTDLAHAKAEEYVRTRNLGSAEADACINLQAKETLASVNLYLGMIAAIVKHHQGTLDKYIGDCVMAFWGAPAPRDTHARACVRAAIEAQRAIAQLNVVRSRLNEQRERENAQRIARGEMLLPVVHTMSLGIGINTGLVTAGLMGSDEHGVNYTAFGRDVNLASRLEARAGADRILIGETTYRELLRDDSALANTCVELEPVTVKGIRQPVKCYEVAWRGAQGTVTTTREEKSAAVLPMIA
jgi:class 3 adenylate cyclase/CHASE2 domain-containing sensor protein